MLQAFTTWYVCWVAPTKQVGENVTFDYVKKESNLYSGFCIVVSLHGRDVLDSWRRWYVAYSKMEHSVRVGEVDGGSVLQRCYLWFHVLQQDLWDNKSESHKKSGDWIQPCYINQDFKDRWTFYLAGIEPSNSSWEGQTCYFVQLELPIWSVNHNSDT